MPGSLCPFGGDQNSRQSAQSGDSCSLKPSSPRSDTIEGGKECDSRSKAGSRSAGVPRSTPSAGEQRRRQGLPTGKARVLALYEAYINLDLLRQVWQSPATTQPVLEPCFAAAFHGIELCFLLLSEFIADDRKYVDKRPRVEMVAEDVITQCKLLTEVIDGELEEDLGMGADPCPDSSSDSPADPPPPCPSRLTLTQPFPFEGCPPTTPTRSHSPGLGRLVAAVAGKVGAMRTGERNSLIKLVHNLSTAFSSFERWSVGLGIEHQLDQLRAAVGLSPLPGPRHPLNLDYHSLVRPQAAELTLTAEQYTHEEDFFFRTVHLGTECWAFVAHNRLRSAAELAGRRRWHVAAARMGQASRVLHYLGSHLLLLTRLNLRDYLRLKVELEGTSGEGSAQVKAFRPAIARLFSPLAETLVGEDLPPTLPPVAVTGAEEGVGEAGDELQQALLRIYEQPDQYAGLYNYAKALEDLETGLLGGFFYKHFCLASNVIGSDAKGTMRRAVQALKGTYETPVFPRLDAVRCQLGSKMDAELAPLKGRMMEGLLARCAARSACQRGGKPHATSAGTAANRDDVAPASQPRSSPVHRGSDGAGVQGEGGGREFDAVRRQLYSLEGTSPEWRQLASTGLRQAVQEMGLKCFDPGTLPPAPQAAPPFTLPSTTTASGTCPPPQGYKAPIGLPSSGPPPSPLRPLAFLSHAWGHPPPLAQQRAIQQLVGWQQVGNPSWGALFGREIPRAATNISRLLGLLPEDPTTPSSGGGAPEGSPPPPPPCTVQFGHNTHELVTRLLSALRPTLCMPPTGQQEGGPGGGRAGGETAPLRVLTSDAEFMSFARQASRLLEEGLVSVDTLPAEPAETFAERCIAAVRAAALAGPRYDLLYVSQITYRTQRTLLPDVAAFVEGVHLAAGASSAQAARAPLVPPASTGADAPSQSFPPSGSDTGQGSSAGTPSQGDAPGTGASAPPLVVVDGSHAWMALPTDLGRVADKCCYLAGLLKHAGCGANCSFITLPSHLRLRPLLTGWLADDSSTHEVQIGSKVAYSAALTFQGGTPGYMLPLLTFNHVMALWEEGGGHCHRPPPGHGGSSEGGAGGIARDSEQQGAAGAGKGPMRGMLCALHDHVIRLQDRFMDGLRRVAHLGVNLGRLVPPQPPSSRSHTLVFDQHDAQQAQRMVDSLAARGVLVDRRQRSVRFGFGANHSAADVDALLAALAAVHVGDVGVGGWAAGQLQAVDN